MEMEIWDVYEDQMDTVVLDGVMTVDTQFINCSLKTIL